MALLTANRAVNSSLPISTHVCISVSSVHRQVCKMQSVVCSVQCSVCSVQRVLQFSMQCIFYARSNQSASLHGKTYQFLPNPHITTQPEFRDQSIEFMQIYRRSCGGLRPIGQGFLLFFGRRRNKYMPFLDFLVFHLLCSV